ncbi:MAG TPA: hypothetical protein VNH11_13135 [Pirellulales bacterium]|nr:hypothetical protein [Pirellulales bacterium]
MSCAAVPFERGDALSQGRLINPQVTAVSDHSEPLFEERPARRDIACHEAGHFVMTAASVEYPDQGALT